MVLIFLREVDLGIKAKGRVHRIKFFKKSLNLTQGPEGDGAVKKNSEKVARLRSSLKREKSCWRGRRESKKVALAQVKYD